MRKFQEVSPTIEAIGTYLKSIMSPEETMGF